MSQGVKVRRKILVVDDQAEMRKSISRILRLSGYDFEEAADGKVALQIVEKGGVDLVLSDLRMPEMDGIELLHNVRRIHSLPFVLMTGFSEALETTEAYELGVDGFLQKPFQQNDLLSSIQEAFDSRLKINERGQTISSEKAIADKFCGIPIEEFLSGREIKFPIFLKLSETKFVKISMGGEDLSSEKVKELKRKGIRFFYLLREDFKHYVSFASKITEAIVASKNVGSSKKASFLKHSSEVILGFGFEQYVDKDIFDLARVNVEQSLSVLTDSPSLLDILDSLTSQSTELYAHSMGVSLVSCLTARALEWESSPLFFRVVAGSIFHDLGKKDFSAELLAKEMEDMSESERALWRDHPRIGAELLANIKDLPSEVLQIVQHHHELCDGSGYPKGLGSKKIHPVAKVVAVSDEFFKVYRKSQMIDMNHIFNVLKKRNRAPGSPLVKWECLPSLQKAFLGV